MFLLGGWSHTSDGFFVVQRQAPLVEKVLFARVLAPRINRLRPEEVLIHEPQKCGAMIDGPDANRGLGFVWRRNVENSCLPASRDRTWI